MGEIWKDIAGFEGIYQISNLGRVRSLSRKVIGGSGIRIMKDSILKQGVGSTGYYLVSLTKNLIPNTQKVHRLVAKAFIPNTENKQEVNHINGIKLDNNISNLEWVTPKENVQHAFRTGLSKATWQDVKGKDNPFSRPIYQLDMSGRIIEEFDSVSNAKTTTRINHISCCAMNKRKSAGGFKWKYKCDITNNN